jgi:hypothetical protein
MRPKQLKAIIEKPYITRWWGQDHRCEPKFVEKKLGNGKMLLGVQPLNTRPNYYVIRVSDKWRGKMSGHDWFNYVEEVIYEAIIDEYSEKERERETLAEDLRAAGIMPDGSNTDLHGNEDRLGWPVMSLDSGCAWWVYEMPKVRTMQKRKVAE